MMDAVHSQDASGDDYPSEETTRLCGEVDRGKVLFTGHGHCAEG